MNTSECDKVLKNNAESLILSNFIDWLRTNGYAICTLQKTDGVPREQWQSYSGDLNTERLLAEYFKIDLDKVEAEKQSILFKLRAEAKI